MCVCVGRWGGYFGSSFMSSLYSVNKCFRQHSHYIATSFHFCLSSIFLLFYLWSSLPLSLLSPPNLNPPLAPFSFSTYFFFYYSFSSVPPLSLFCVFSHIHLLSPPHNLLREYDVKEWYRYIYIWNAEMSALMSNFALTLFFPYKCVKEDPMQCKMRIKRGERCNP